jgi:hypothetical protein
VENVTLDAGRWTDAENGDRIWRLRLSSENALATELYFQDFHLPRGAAMYIYDEAGEHVLGGFTAFNNADDGVFVTGLVPGASCIVEYDEPLAVRGEGRFRIAELGHAYRLLGGSEPCEVDVNCSEGADWENERDAVVRISVRLGADTYWCTGALVNNMEQDCKPYFLTAKHCGTYDNGNDATATDYNQWRFYFKFQKPGCGTGTGIPSTSVTGCVERGDSEDEGGESGSDFLLLEANNPTIPASYNPYWAGWDANTAATTGGRGIHHPAGDVKKISRFNGTTLSASWGVSGSHWRVVWVETENGHGVTEPGSSGSPLFNNSHRIVGTLTGGFSCCTDGGCVPANLTGPDEPDFYGKMSYHWTNNPNSANDKLKHWLDPENTGTLVLDGSANPCAGMGMEDVTHSVAPEVYPNPATDRLTVVYPQGIERVERIELVDVSGRVVRTFVPLTTGQAVMELEGQAEGLYLVRITAAGLQHQAAQVALVRP